MQCQRKRRAGRRQDRRALVARAAAVRPSSPWPSPPLIHFPQTPGARSASLAPRHAARGAVAPSGPAVRPSSRRTPGRWPGTRLGPGLFISLNRRSLAPCGAGGGEGEQASQSASPLRLWGRGTGGGGESAPGVAIVVEDGRRRSRGIPFIPLIPLIPAVPFIPPDPGESRQEFGVSVVAGAHDVARAAAQVEAVKRNLGCSVSVRKGNALGSRPTIPQGR